VSIQKKLQTLAVTIGLLGHYPYLTYIPFIIGKLSEDKKVHYRYE